MDNLKNKFEAINKFPIEKEGHEIIIDGNDLIYKFGKVLYSRKIKISELEYIYLIINPKNPDHHGSTMYFSSDHGAYIPTCSIGFKKAFDLLKEKYPLDEELFFSYVNSNEEKTIAIWKKESPTSFSIINNYKDDLKYGFEILSPQREFIKWETTFEALCRNKNTYLKITEHGHKLLYFHYPVRVENIVINNCHVGSNNYRLDIPIQSLSCRCYLENEGIKSYRLLKKALFEAFGESNHFYERKDANHYSNKTEEIEISITYWHEKEYQVESFYTVLCIRNERLYPNLTLNKEYDNIISIDIDLVFDNEFIINKDYMKYSQVKERPKKITERFNDKAVLWNDQKNGLLGFSINDTCLLFQKSEIKSISILNIRPARWGNSCSLIIDLKDNRKVIAFSGKYKELDSYISKIRETTEMDLILEEKDGDNTW
jgi:hypothetical protein